MNLKILCQNIANNPGDLSASDLEEMFKEYANDKLTEVFDNLSDGGRMVVMSDYCIGCGTSTKEKICHCLNDE